MIINIQRYWKIFLIISIIILTIVFFIYTEKYSTVNKYNDEKYEIFQNILNCRDIPYKVNIYLDKEEFENMKIPENKVAYYFPEECPSYKNNVFLYTKINGLDKYYIPEQHYLIIINKDHTWTNNPDKLVFWKK